MHQGQRRARSVPLGPARAARTAREIHHRTNQVTSIKKPRLDQVLVQRGFFETRAKAQAAILAGEVEVKGFRCDKAGHPVDPDAEIRVKPRPQWVSRGAEKLAAAFERFEVSCAGKICLDIGAGSGGFTQVLLDRGAARVYAVDVGYGQFDAKLRNRPNVVLLERTNARSLTAKNIPEPIGFLVMDVSFISILKIIPAILPFLSPAADGVILFKPNFEARRDEVQKGGLLLDPQIHLRLLTAAHLGLADLKLNLLDLIPSPIRGGDGNIEYLLAVTRRPAPAIRADQIPGVISAAFGPDKSPCG